MAMATKHDPTHSTRETSDFPSLCTPCLGPNPYIQMLKSPSDLECKLCLRPFTVFRWSTDRTSRTSKTNICLTCARLKNCCQCCMLDLSFGLPIAVRDAALKMVKQGPQGELNRQYWAGNLEKGGSEGGMAAVEEEREEEEGRARGLLKRLAESRAYRRNNQDDDSEQPTHRPGPMRHRGGGRGGRGGSAPRGAAQNIPIGPAVWQPPADTSITSLFLSGVEDDLAEHQIRSFFGAFGQLKSVVVVHRSRSAFVNFVKREGAEAAAESCRGKALVGGCLLRVMWGKPRALGGGKEGPQRAREVEREVAREGGLAGRRQVETPVEQEARSEKEQEVVLPKPPGEEDDAVYAAQRG